MAEVPTFDWTGLTGKAVEKLKKDKVPPRPPDEIVAAAQRSWDGVPKVIDGKEEILHVQAHQFKTVEQAAEFAKLVKDAGPHTTPPTSVQPVIDPFETGDKRLVHWRAGKPRGRKPAS